MATTPDKHEISPELSVAGKEEWAQRNAMLNALDHPCWDDLQQQIRAPQVVVCGNQSSGKSTVLKELSSLTFPVNDGLCTRFVTKLVLRRNKSYLWTSRIIPDPDRQQTDQDRLRRFRCSDKDSPGSKADLEAIVKEAGRIMGVHQDESFQADILEVRVSGPNLPCLTLVDLPGLIDNPSEEQTQRDVDFIRRTVDKFMKDKNIIVLAVVDGSADIQVQAVLSKIVDFQTGTRTVGVITKPDLIMGKNKTDKVYKLASNAIEKYRLEYGWFLLRNRAEGEEHFSDAERDQIEHKLLEKYPWTSLPEKAKGRASLHRHLRQIWYNFFTQQVPQICSELRAKVHEVDKQLLSMPATPRDVAEARDWLKNIIDQVQPDLDEFFRLCTAPRSRQRGYSEVVHTTFDALMQLNSRLTSSLSIGTPENFSDTDVAMTGVGVSHGGNQNSSITARAKELLPQFSPSAEAFPFEVASALISEELCPLKKQLEIYFDDVAAQLRLFLGNLFAKHIAQPFVQRVQDHFAKEVANAVRRKLIALAPSWVWSEIATDGAGPTPTVDVQAFEAGKAARHLVWQEMVAQSISDIFRTQPDAAGRFPPVRPDGDVSYDLDRLYQRLTARFDDHQLVVAGVVGCVKSQCEVSIWKRGWYNRFY